MLAGNQFDLAALNGGNYRFGENLYSKEPAALVTRDDDAQWSDFVNWVFLALLIAETQSITQATARTIVLNPGPAVDSSQLSFYRAVAAVGNYGEMYRRHLETILPRAPVNQQNNGTAPLIYSYPFGDSAAIGPGPFEGGTFDAILKRGYLICGTMENAFFGSFDHTVQEWVGFYVDYCRAVSSAIFNGQGSTVIIPVTATTRFELLQNGTIDVLSMPTTWNHDRDVNEPSTNVGFTFSSPVFYTGLQFGGVPM